MHDFENSLFYTKKGIVELTDIENRLLDLLIKNKGHIVNYRHIMKKIYKSKEDDALRRRIATNICRIRHKLKGELVIKTRINIGFWIEG